MVATTTWGLPLVDDTMPISPIQGLINPIASALDAGLTNLQTTEHNGVTVVAVGNLPTTGNWKGRSIFVQSNLTFYTWTGTAWHTTSGQAVPFAMAAGVATVNVASGGNFDSVAVTFPAGRFVVAPIVTVSITSAPGGSQILIPRSFNSTTSGCSVAVYSGNFPSGIPNAISMTLGWTAIQMESALAAG